MSDFTDEDVTAVREVLANYGLGSESTIHSSWRCFDKERYPERCDCLDEISRDILRALLPGHDQRVKAKALREVADDATRIIVEMAAQAVDRLADDVLNRLYGPDVAETARKYARHLRDSSDGAVEVTELERMWRYRATAIENGADE